jgi:anthranilate synthase/aminodeoxychorismate synthase-like glutamine amidotransferase
MITMIDNYDSFTWNLVQQIERLSGTSIEVVRNDEFDVERLLSSPVRAIVISPGPGNPSKAGRIVELVRANRAKPILGVCLGHQAIGEAFGGKVVRGKMPVHGKPHDVSHDGGGLFAGCPSPFKATRYHSLVIERESMPAELVVDAETGDGAVMAVRHRDLPVYGIQFHPESYGTESGDIVVANFLRSAGVLPEGGPR